MCYGVQTDLIRVSSIGSLCCGSGCSILGVWSLPELGWDLVPLGLPIVEELEEGQRGQLGPGSLVLHLVGLQRLAVLSDLVLGLGFLTLLDHRGLYKENNVHVDMGIGP